MNQIYQEEDVVSLFVHEGDMARMERGNKRLAWALVISLLISVAAVVATNLVWIVHETNQMEKMESMLNEVTEGNFQIGDEDGH